MRSSHSRQNSRNVPETFFDEGNATFQLNSNRTTNLAMSQECHLTSPNRTKSMTSNQFHEEKTNVDVQVRLSKSNRRNTYSPQKQHNSQQQLSDEQLARELQFQLHQEESEITPSKSRLQTMHRHASAGEPGSLQRRQSEQVNSSRHVANRSDEEVARELQRQLLTESRHHQEHEAAYARQQQLQTLSDEEMARELQRQLEYEDAYRRRDSQRDNRDREMDRQEQFLQQNEEAQELERQAAELLRVQQGEMLLETGSTASDLTFDEEVYLERLPHAALTVGGEHYDPNFQQNASRDRQRHRDSQSLAQSVGSSEMWSPPQQQREAPSIASNRAPPSPQMSPANINNNNTPRHFFPQQGSPDMRSCPPHLKSSQPHPQSSAPSSASRPQSSRMHSSHGDSFSPSRPSEEGLSPREMGGGRSDSHRGLQEEHAAHSRSRSKENHSSSKTQMQLQQEMYTQLQRDRHQNDLMFVPSTGGEEAVGLSRQQSSSRPQEVVHAVDTLDASSFDQQPAGVLYRAPFIQSMQRTASFFEGSPQTAVCQSDAQQERQYRTNEMVSSSTDMRSSSQGHRRTASSGTGEIGAKSTHSDRYLTTINSNSVMVSGSMSGEQSSNRHVASHHSRHATSDAVVADWSQLTSSTPSPTNAGGTPLKRGMTAKISVLVSKYETNEHNEDGNARRQLSRHSSVKDPNDSHETSRVHINNSPSIPQRRGSQKTLSIVTTHGVSSSALTAAGHTSSQPTSRSTPSSGGDQERGFVVAYPLPSSNTSPVVTAHQHAFTAPSDYNRKMNTIRQQSGLSLVIGTGDNALSSSVSHIRTETPTTAALAQSQEAILRARQSAALLADEQLALHLQMELNGADDLQPTGDCSPSPSLSASHHSRVQTSQQCRDDEELAREYQNLLDARHEKNKRSSPRAGPLSRSESFYSKASSGNSSSDRQRRGDVSPNRHASNHSTLSRIQSTGHSGGHSESFYSKGSNVSDGSHGKLKARESPILMDKQLPIHKRSPLTAATGSKLGSPAHKLPSPHNHDASYNAHTRTALVDTVKPKGIASQPSDGDMIDATQQGIVNSRDQVKDNASQSAFSPIRTPQLESSEEMTTDARGLYRSSQSMSNNRPSPSNRASPSREAVGVRGLSGQHSKSFSVNRSPSLSPVPAVHDRDITHDFSGLPGSSPTVIRARPLSARHTPLPPNIDLSYSHDTGDGSNHTPNHNTLVNESQSQRDLRGGSSTAPSLMSPPRNTNPTQHRQHMLRKFSSHMMIGTFDEVYTLELQQATTANSFQKNSQSNTTHQQQHNSTDSDAKYFEKHNGLGDNRSSSQLVDGKSSKPVSPPSESAPGTALRRSPPNSMYLTGSPKLNPLLSTKRSHEKLKDTSSSTLLIDTALHSSSSNSPKQSNSLSPTANQYSTVTTPEPLNTSPDARNMAVRRTPQSNRGQQVPQEVIDELKQREQRQRETQTANRQVTRSEEMMEEEKSRDSSVVDDDESIEEEKDNDEDEDEEVSVLEVYIFEREQRALAGHTVDDRGKSRRRVVSSVMRDMVDAVDVHAAYKRHLQESNQSGNDKLVDVQPSTPRSVNIFDVTVTNNNVSDNGEDMMVVTTQDGVQIALSEREHAAYQKDSAAEKEERKNKKRAFKKEQRALEKQIQRENATRPQSGRLSPSEIVAVDKFDVHSVRIAQDSRRSPSLSPSKRQSLSPSAQGSDGELARLHAMHSQNNATDGNTGGFDASSRSQGVLHDMLDTRTRPLSFLGSFKKTLFGIQPTDKVTPLIPYNTVVRFFPLESAEEQIMLYTAGSEEALYRDMIKKQTEQLAIDRHRAARRARMEHERCKKQVLTPVMEAFPTFLLMGKQWLSVAATVDSVLDGICVSILLPHLQDLRIDVVDSSKRSKGDTLSIEAVRCVYPADRHVNDANSLYFGRFKLEGFGKSPLPGMQQSDKTTNAIDKHNISYLYASDVGMLFVYVDRLQLQQTSPMPLPKSSDKIDLPVLDQLSSRYNHFAVRKSIFSMKSSNGASEQINNRHSYNNSSARRESHAQHAVNLVSLSVAKSRSDSDKNTLPMSSGSGSEKGRRDSRAAAAAAPPTRSRTALNTDTFFAAAGADTNNASNNNLNNNNSAMCCTPQSVSALETLFSDPILLRGDSSVMEIYTAPETTSGVQRSGSVTGLVKVDSYHYNASISRDSPQHESPPQQQQSRRLSLNVVHQESSPSASQQQQQQSRATRRGRSSGWPADTTNYNDINNNKHSPVQEEGYSYIDKSVKTEEGYSYNDKKNKLQKSHLEENEKEKETGGYSYGETTKTTTRGAALSRRMAVMEEY